ncbi:MAG: methyltransferase domain-containing protein, partial [Candidatus Paceibacterota bacterium]
MKTKNAPKKDPRLDGIGKKLAIIDEHLVRLLAIRIKLARQVAMVKIEAGEKIFRPSVENTRLKKTSRLAKKEGLNPNFLFSLLYNIIGESCKQQMGIVDDFRLKRKFERYNPTPEEFRKNLLQLTKEWSKQYEEKYGDQHGATLALREFEHRIIDESINELKDNDLMLDLGCATGKEMRRISKSFRSLRGIDISKHMVEVGLKAVIAEEVKNVSLEVGDIEKPWILDDSSVSFIVMNNGTGSDIHNLDFILSEIKRVLKPEGRFVLSFYNKGAWTQQVFFPWPLGLMAGMDQERKCLEVLSKGKFVPIYAQPYSMEEVLGKFSHPLHVLKSFTYPTLQSLLPAEVMTSKVNAEMILV